MAFQFITKYLFDLRQKDVLGSFSFLSADALTRFKLGPKKKKKDAVLFFVTLITIARKIEFQQPGKLKLVNGLLSAWMICFVDYYSHILFLFRATRRGLGTVGWDYSQALVRDSAFII